MKLVPLRFNYEFSRTYKRGRVAAGKCLSLHCFKRPVGLKHNLTLVPKDMNRTGFCANKKKLGAVGRNRARRLMREAYRNFANDIPKGYDLVFTLRNNSTIPSYDSINNEMKGLLTKVGLIDTRTEHEDGGKAVD